MRVSWRAFTENGIIQNRTESVVKRSKPITDSAEPAAATTAKTAVVAYILAYSPKDEFSVPFKVKSRHI